MGTTLELKRFDISSVPCSNVIAVIGKRNTGKLFLVKDLLYQHRDLPIGTVVSPTESTSKFFGDIVPPLFIHDAYTPKVLDKVVRRQKAVLSTIQRQVAAKGACNIDPRAFLVLDNCMYDEAWQRDKNIRMLFMNGRCIKIMVVITLPYPLGVPSVLRVQINYVFIFRENNVSTRRLIYDNYAGMFPTFDAFCQVMDQFTESFECLVIDNTVRSERLEDQVFWYRAEPRPNFRIGASQFWQLSEQLVGHGADESEEGAAPPSTPLDAARPLPLEAKP